MPELMIDFITSLDGYGAAEGWPGFWGLEGPEYLGWLGEEPQGRTVLMGANTYRLMSSLVAEGEPGTEVLAGMSKIVFSSTLTEPLSWANTRLVGGDPVEAVRALKEEGRRAAAHAREPHAVPLAPRCGPRRSLPRGRLPSHHRQHRSRPDLRRIPGRRPRHGRQPRVRRSAPAPRVRPQRARRATRNRGRDDRLVRRSDEQAQV